MPLDSQKSLNSWEVYSPPLSERKALSFIPFSVSTEAIHFLKIEYTSPFCFMGYTQTFLVASSINVTNYKAPPNDLVGIGPHTSV